MLFVSGFHFNRYQRGIRNLKRMEITYRALRSGLNESQRENYECKTNGHRAEWSTHRPQLACSSAVPTGKVGIQTNGHHVAALSLGCNTSDGEIRSLKRMDIT